MVKSHSVQIACSFSWWAGVLCLLVLLPTVECQPKTLQELEGVLSSHNQSLMKFNSYLTYVDQFYHWYSVNHRRLDDLLAESQAGSAVEGGTPPLVGEKAMQDLTKRVQLLENAIGSEELQWVLQRAEQTVHMSTLEAQLKELEEQLRQKDVQIEELKSSVNLTKGNLAMFIRQMAAQSNRSVEELATNLTRVTERIDQSESKIESLVAESSKTMLSPLEARIQALENSSNLSLANTLYHDATINSMQGELQHVINKTDQYDALQGTLNNLQSKAEQFKEDQLEDRVRMEQMKTTVRDELATLGGYVNKSTSGMEEALQIINQDVSEVKGSIRQATTERTALLQKVDAVKESWQDTNVRFSSIQDSLQMLGTKTSGLDTTIGSLQGGLSRLQSRVDGAERATTTALSTVSTLTSRVDDLAGEVKTVGGRNSAAGANAAAVQELRNKLEELERMVNEKSNVRERGDELLNRIATGSRGAIRNRNGGGSMSAAGVASGPTLGLGG